MNKYKKKKSNPFDAFLLLQSLGSNEVSQVLQINNTYLPLSHTLN